MLFTIASLRIGVSKSDLSIKKLTAFCVELYGGGYNATQTIVAMELSRKIIRLKPGQTHTDKGFEFTRQLPVSHNYPIRDPHEQLPYIDEFRLCELVISIRGNVVTVNAHGKVVTLSSNLPRITIQALDTELYERRVRDYLSNTFSQ